MSPATAAGIPASITVGAPGPTIEPPWVLTSPTRAAGAFGAAPSWICTTPPVTLVVAPPDSSAVVLPSSLISVPPFAPNEVPASSCASVPAFIVNAFALSI